MGCYFLLQGIFLTQGSNLRLLCLLHWQVSSLPPACLLGPNYCVRHGAWPLYVLAFHCELVTQILVPVPYMSFRKDEWLVLCRISAGLRMKGFPGGSDSKESTCSVRDWGSIPGLGRSPGEGNGNPLQYSCLENSMDKGDWQATVHGTTKSWM